MGIDFDPYSTNWKLDPYPAYRKLRIEAPVHLSPETHTWCISRHDDVETVLTNPEVFSSRVASASREAEIAAMGPLEKARMVVRLFLDMRVTPWEASRARILISEDGAVHHGMRTIVNRGFTRRRIRVWEERIDGLVEEYLEGIERNGCFDLVRELAVPLPVTVIAEMLGVEPEHMDRFKQWSDAIVQLVGGPSMGADLFSAKSLIEVRKYILPIVRARRANQEDDLISTLVVAEPGDEPLSDFELLMFFVLLLVAGNETTTNLLGNCVDGLLANRDALEKVLDDPSLIPNLVEETLRWDNPVQFVNRVMAEDYEMHGVMIPKGAFVAVLLGSANRDEGRWEDPDHFDPSREIGNHLGFGFGHHFCLGASLARLEAIGALRMLVPELRGLRRASAHLELLGSHTIRGRARLELRPAN